MGFFGNLIGSGLGAIGSKFLPIPGVDGRKLGGAIGGLMPFKKGGLVPRTVPKPVISGYRKGGKVKKRGRKRKVGRPKK